MIKIRICTTGDSQELRLMEDVSNTIMYHVEINTPNEIDSKERCSPRYD